MEFLLLSLMTAGAPLATIALTILLVNSRHVFYCLTFPLHRVRGRLGRVSARFALIDEAYALTTALAAQGYSSRRTLTMQMTMHAYWVGSGIIGALLGSAVPRSLDGLDFALVGLFIVLAVDSCRTGTTSPAGCSRWCVRSPRRSRRPAQMLLVGMSLFVGVHAIRLRLTAASPFTRAARA